ncbi:hypothetical protein [Halalkalibacter urbisdiaboli]|uniref:hypothetical protein n=1 Tax=Halalkalibacter urbisdiaboli TaxID=1960589 RepID=UPI0013FDF807|nr:hypothetical protein [Halalkalibacter urbisdiaboli]
MELSNYQWLVLERNIEVALKEKIISDYSLLAKTKKQTLTVSELAWLNNVILQQRK